MSMPSVAMVFRYSYHDYETNIASVYIGMRYSDSVALRDVGRVRCELLAAIFRYVNHITSVFLQRRPKGCFHVSDTSPSAGPYLEQWEEDLCAGVSEKDMLAIFDVTVYLVLLLTPSRHFSKRLCTCRKPDSFRYNFNKPHEYRWCCLFKNCSTQYCGRMNSN